MCASSTQYNFLTDRDSVVAVHGIGADAFQTWQQKNETYQPPKVVDWLEDGDMLPSIIPDTRIMTFGYESTWAGPNPIRITASQIAERFLRDLKGIREVRDPTADRDGWC